jgi:hypothetical protein
VSGVNEAAGQTGGQFQANLLAGLKLLSSDAQIVFAQYIRHVLPLDGYVFWLKTMQTLIPGSLHYAAQEQQNYDESFAIRRVVFTTGTMVKQFDEIDPDTIWIGEAAGLKFAFSQQAPFYGPSGVYHYRGDAVYPAMETQLVDVGSELSDKTLIVSNSLPSWLTLKSYSPPWLVAPNPCITLYPSFLVPDNLRPPYGAVHIPPDATEPMAGLPLISQNGLHSQLACDRVLITLYGATNAEAMAFLDLVNQYSMDTDAIGIMSAAVARDEKRTQTELGVIAMKKSFAFEVDYLQEAMPSVALKLIKSAPITYIIQ